MTSDMQEIFRIAAESKRLALNERRATIARLEGQVERLRSALRLVILCAEQQATQHGHYVVLPSYVEHDCRQALIETDSPERPL